jgi:uncharacterized protein YaaW (UPF0174 family)
VIENSDKDLVEYLCSAEPETILALVDVLQSVLSRDARTLLDAVTPSVPEQGSKERQDLADAMVRQLRYFGSDSVAYLGRKALKREPGAHYHEILRDTVELMNAQLKNRESIPRIASVGDLEHRLCEIVLRAGFQKATPEKIAQMLVEGGLDRDAAIAAAANAAKWAAGGAGVVALVSLLGKKTVKEILQRAIIELIATKLGRDVAEKIVGRLQKRYAQKTIAAFISGIGWLLLAWDVANLRSPATRVTLPCVALIAMSRRFAQ